MKGLNFLEACEALRDGKCKEIENETGNRYSIHKYLGLIRNSLGGAVALSPSSFLGVWRLVGVKKKVVIEDVGWHQRNTGIIYPALRSGSFDWGSLLNKPRMKITLEWEE